MRKMTIIMNHQKSFVCHNTAVIVRSKCFFPSSSLCCYGEISKTAYYSPFKISFNVHGNYLIHF